MLIGLARLSNDNHYSRPRGVALSAADESIAGVHRLKSVLGHIRLGQASWLFAMTLALATTCPVNAQERNQDKAPERTAGPLTLRFSLDGRIEGPSALFLLPLDRGYYKREGLDVAIEDAETAQEPIARVAAGSHAMGLADINAYIRFRDQNPAAPLQAVFVVYNRPPFAIVGRKSRGIEEPKSLEGKLLGAPPATPTIAQWPIFARLNDVDVSRVKLESIALPVHVPMLAAGQLDAALGYSFRLYVDLKERGVPVGDIVQLQMPNYKMKLYGAAVVVNTKVATERPEAIKGFLRATVHGIRDVIRNPALAVEPVLRRQELAKKDVEIERLRIAIRENIVTPEVRANGLGAIELDRLEESIGQIALGYTFKARPTAKTLFDPSFLQPVADRKPN